MFFPLAVLVAVLPGLFALNNWDLNPPGPWWGLRALAVLGGAWDDQVPAVVDLQPHLRIDPAGPAASRFDPDDPANLGAEAQAYLDAAYQPPLYAWLAAVGLALTPARDPWAVVLPSYAAGAALVILTYLHGRLWRGPGLGLVAAVLTGFNPLLLDQMQGATPTTLALATTSAALYAYGRHLRVGAGPARPWGRDGGLAWAVVGGLALGASLLTLGGFGLCTAAVVALHQAYLRAGDPSERRSGPWWRSLGDNPSLVAGTVAVALAAALALPWYVLMLRRHGMPAAAALLWPGGAGPVDVPDLLSRVLALAPAALPLAVLAAARAIRQALIAETEDRETVGGVFWVVWLAIAALLPALWSGGPEPVLDLFLLLPLDLLAASAIVDLANRRVPVRTLTWLAPLTAVAIAWWGAANLRGAVDDLLHGRATSATALGLHLALDLLIAVIVFTRGLDRWARRRDDRQRQVLAGFLGFVVLSTVAAGAREARFRHSENRDLIDLREIVLRRHGARPFELLVVVGPDEWQRAAEGPAPGGRLRFILRSALPEVPRVDLPSVDALLELANDRCRLVILVGTEQRLSYALQSRLGLEPIHPGRSGVLDALATIGPTPPDPAVAPRAANR